ncbi:MAG TPA: GntR family transcriptional regulator [Gammaproteobacteria bacterium]|nr:GntR family transcriptional regulator [Gammaproteobacteria bacterium]
MTGKARSNTQRLRDALEDDIINGRLAPGERLDPETLGSRFGVSRTPVREAIQQLAASGLVTVVPKRGTFVAEIGLTQLIEMFEVMAELEGMCGRLAARRISPQEAAALREALEGCRRAQEAGDSDDYYYENEGFHHRIYEASHNGFLATEANNLHMRLKPYRRLQLRVKHRTRRSLQEHEAIVEALLAGDEHNAERLLREHVLIQGERFSDLVATVRDMSSLATVEPG